MTDPAKTPQQAPGNASTTLVYKKTFAVVGVVCGLLLFFGTPPLVLQFHEGFDTNYSVEWVETMPTWVAPTMLMIGMVGGVLMVLVSALAGVLIPSQVTRHLGASSTPEKTTSSTAESARQPDDSAQSAPRLHGRITE